MKIKELSKKQILLIIGLLIVILGCVLFALESYFSYLEVKSLADKCYDDGGFPTVEKSGFKIDHFSCYKS